MRFTDILVKNGIIGQGKLAKVVTQSEETGIALEKALKAEGVSEDDILNAKAEISGFAVKKVSPGQVSFDALKKIPEEAARHYRFVPLGAKDGFLEVGVVDPSDIEAKRALQFIVSRMNLPVKTFIVSEDDFETVLGEYKGLGGEVSRALGDLEMELSDAGSAAMEAMQKELSGGGSKDSKIVEDAPVTKIVAVILRHALEGNASDVHIEAVSDRVKIRFRVDGVMYTSIVLPLTIHEAIVSRIKILTDLKIDREMIARPYGLVLLTGPTGSGKTTTLYAMLKELDREVNNVVSLEDPIEYNIEGVNQSQVRPEIGYDFASGLRTILRQDPDIIMVGEIRDKETAAMAIHAALTGHLVLSTLHTNNAAGVVPRLVDMGVDPYLIAPTLLMVIGQRLVKKLCPDARKEKLLEGSFKEITQNELKNMPDEARKKITSFDKIYEGVSSPNCPMGSKGRTGIFEVLYKTPALESLILTKPSEQDILKESRKQGMITIKQDGLIKALNGLISFDEFLKL